MLVLEGFSILEIIMQKKKYIPKIIKLPENVTVSVH